MTMETDGWPEVTSRNVAAARTVRLFPMAIAVSLVVHALLLAVSTTLQLRSGDELGRDAARLFKVEITHMIPERHPIAPPPPPAPATVASIEEILDEETAREPPTLPGPPDASAETLAEQMRDKGRREYLPREGAAEISAESADTVDLRVVALAEDALGEGLGPRRRPVMPGGGIVVPAAELPTWSAPGAAGAAAGRAAAAARPDVVVRETQSEAEIVEDMSRKVAREEPGLADLHGKLAGAGDRLLPERLLPSDVLPMLEEREAVRKYEPLDELLDVELYTYRPAGTAGYFLVRINARADAPLTVLPKDIVFVIDSSKSMGQRKLDEGREGVRKCIEQLNPYDRFNIVAFSREPVFFANDLVDATLENRRRAERFLKGLVSGGQTDVYAALQPLVARTARENVPYVIMLFSDGKSTVGDLDSREIINQVTEINRRAARASIFAFGGGSSVNRYLLDLLALRNKGASEITRVVSRIDKDMPSFYNRLRDPILADVTANYSGLDIETIYPRRLPDFFLGSDIAVLGRFDTEQEFSMRLTGVVNGRRKELVFRRRFDDARPGGEDVARQWALSKAYNVIEQICARGPMPELVRELELLNTQYGVRTAYNEYGSGQ